jgi:hypothetical protein
MRGRATCACVMALVASGAAAQTPAQSSQLAVCLVLSPKLSISVRAAALVLAESNAIWSPHGVGVRWAQPSDDGCDRRISVKGDQEAPASESALGWVPFVEGRAAQLVFLRVGRARTLIDALSPGTRPEALTEFLVARLLGRSLGHELGHVLLNSRSHEDSGLMRARYRARDVLSVPTSAYTLNAVERARLFARIAGEPRLPTR